MRRRILITMAIAALVAMLAPATALAKHGQYPPKEPTCSAAPYRVKVGGGVTAIGHHWGGTQVRISLVKNGTFLLGFGTVHNGNFAKHVTLPSDTTTGPAKIKVSGRDQSGDYFTCFTNILLYSSKPTSASLPSEPAIPLGVGLLLVLAAGAGVFELNRRRRVLSRQRADRR